jgi:hypothetical protein
MMAFMFVFVLGSIDFLFLLYQWNATTKAVQLGARIAAVSDPVATGLRGLSMAVIDATVSAGTPMPFFEVKCIGSTRTCTCSGACIGVSGYSVDAMNAIIFGRGSSSCTDATSPSNVGMCDIAPRIGAANVVITYTQTGLGYAGRPGGPAPTITLSIQNLPFEFFFLSGLIGFKTMQMPRFTTSMTAEDLSSSAPLM